MTSERSRDGLIGHVLDDRYEVVSKLARGGMATVYLAQDLRLSRTVAIKIMNDGLGDADDFARRFDAEARAAAHLSHPNVVSVFDQGSDDGRPYIVMEYVQGCTLRNLITREAPMEPGRVLDLLEPVCSALAAAHAAGIIHRDVKPENVLISDRGEVKVADFGLARAITAQSHAATTGLVIGTVSYIAPELVTRGRADARSDVYSLGIVMYEMLTGRKPHTGDEPIQVAYSHVHHQITAPSMELSTTWRDSRDPLPAYVDALVTTAANRDRPNRPLDAGVLLAHLRQARAALGRGVTEDAHLVARMRETTLSEETTAAVPPVPHAAMPAERRFTPVTPVSPSFDVSADGAPFYSTGPVPYSPQSPITRSLPTLGPDDPPPSRHRVRWGRLVALLVALVVLAGGGWGSWYLLAGRWTTAPALATLTQVDAQAAAQASDLGVVFEQEYSEDVPAGQVIRTEPAEGERVLREGVLTAYVSRGPERYAVPELVGRTRAEAEAALAALTLAPSVTEAYDDDAPAGQVLAQGTDAGTSVRRATTVGLTVSLGPAPVEVTDFTGEAASDAQAWAEENAITLKVTEEHSDTVARGVVMSQEPAAGTLHRGDAVSMVVSKGPELVTIPSGLRGRGAEAVAEQLQALGFRTQYNRLVSGQLGLVLRIEPAEGTAVPKGSMITIHVV
ncbi:Stk1 family PASTA domain-containing Ser/Thr kinase [Propioniciclava soli]|uniref:Stk1 family PASTA domain-containing Ser/Thr kinase n=1 Tax=Propioniciclava soli TaxID=2775081 RepID=UPI001E3DFB4B|nr:Stk1 family PASTA domain-containing Ser/Thr kinase [Propioniciclava soli]